MMTGLATLAAVRCRLGRKALDEMNWATAAVAAAFSILALLVILAAFFVFRQAFATLLDDRLAGPLIARYVLESAFAVVFFLGAVSFVISSDRFLFRADEVRLLAALPVEPLAVFCHRFTASVAAAAWPVFLIGAPALAALGSVLGAPAEYYLFSLALLALFTCGIVAAGGLASFFFAWAGRRLAPGRLWLAETAAAVLGLVVLAHRLMPRSLFTVLIAASAAEARQSADKIDGWFAGSPGHVFVQAIVSLLPFGADDRSAGAGIFWAAVAVAVALTLLLLAANRWYLPLWQSGAEGGFLARPEDAPTARPRRSFPRVFLWKYGFLFEKEALAFLRDAGETSRAGFLLILLGLCLLVMRSAAAVAVADSPETRALVAASVFAVIGYFALTLVLRFVFPALSVEGRSAWVVWSSPLHIHEVFSWKLFFWTAAVTAPLLAAAGLTVAIFNWPVWFGLLFIFAVLCAVAALTAVALGQGCLFPNWRERDPDVLSTSPSGLATAGIGLVYLWIVSRYVRGFAQSYFTAGIVDVKSVFGILIVSWGVITVYWLVAPRHLDRLEFPS